MAEKNKPLKCLKKKISPSLPVASHNRQKNYILKEGTHIPFLIALGVMTQDGKVIAKKYDKFRQVNRFLEMIQDVVEYLPKNRPIEIVDFGCGKAYLTFALYHYLRNLSSLPVHITGLDLKQEVIASCQKLAVELGYEDLHFKMGDINHYNPAGKIDLVITLHACDTATDAALAKAVDWKAEVILCVPCCQHELYGQIKNQELTSLLSHGILRERFSALVTDAARAELLTGAGYETQILEFIDMEHTPKNLLLRAIKGASPQQRSAAAERFQRFKENLKFDITLERLLP
jgi:SAM-dependent methyltransferase